MADVMMLATIRWPAASVSFMLSEAPNASSGVISDRAVAATVMIAKVPARARSQR